MTGCGGDCGLPSVQALPSSPMALLPLPERWCRLSWQIGDAYDVVADTMLLAVGTCWCYSGPGGLAHVSHMSFTVSVICRAAPASTQWQWDCSASGQGEILDRLAGAGSDGARGCRFLLRGDAKAFSYAPLRAQPRSCSGSHWQHTPWWLRGPCPLQLAAWRRPHFKPPPPRRRAQVTAGARVADVKNLFVGVGGMGDLPGLPAVGGGYGGGFGNNGAGFFTGVTGPLGGVGGGVGSITWLHGVVGAGGISIGGFAGGGIPFGGLGGRHGSGGAGAVAP
ncbi:uncharacterized protein [Triticum aestivum]|uniref:uncharacterized protein n=1 Tax=Triticum aestivum TaxID=4565 RepID=UPI001D03369C|nr:uncharacterized protein LOC123101676 [Triticum aestivum]